MFFTGFEGCNSTAEVANFFNASYLIYYDAAGGYGGGKCLEFANGTAWALANTPAGQTKAVGFHTRGVGQSAYSTSVAACLVKFGGPDIRVFNTSGGLEVYRGSTLIGSCADYVTTDLQHVTAKCYSHASAGTFELRINGVTKINLTGVNTGGTAISGVYWGGVATVAPAAYYIDNLYIADDWQGELKSFLGVTVADVVSDFAPLSGVDNYAMVDEIGSDGDTSYVSSETVGAKDLYTMTTFPAGVEVVAATVVMVGKKDDVGTRVVDVIARQGGVDYSLAAVGLGTAYPTAHHDGIVTIDTAPDGTAWTVDKLNAVSWGFEVTT